MKKIYSLLALVALGASVAVVGCGGDDDSKSKTPPGGEAGDTGTGGDDNKGTGGDGSGGDQGGGDAGDGNMGGGGAGGAG